MTMMAAMMTMKMAVMTRTTREAKAQVLHL
jgi:hypothetical protein